MSRRVIAFLALLLPLLVIALVSARARPQPRGDFSALARRLPAPDLALASGARHVRLPSLEEPSAGFEDSPGLLDLDPAGGFFLPSGPSVP